jgi:hypothetical protein
MTLLIINSCVTNWRSGLDTPCDRDMCTISVSLVAMAPRILRQNPTSVEMAWSAHCLRRHGELTLISLSRIVSLIIRKSLTLADSRLTQTLACFPAGAFLN